MIYHTYIFLKSHRSINNLSPQALGKYKKKFIEKIEKNTDVQMYSYVMLGLKVNFSILLWMQSDHIETIQDFINILLHTKLGTHLKMTYSLFGMARPTKYSSNSALQIDTSRKGGKYLIIYPFTKTTDWYMMDFEKRKQLMKGHITIGRKYPQISQILLYSYGVDDQEFIVSYETDNLLDFQSLVMELRSDPVRAYTLKDTPIFTCVYKPIDEILEFL